MTRALGSLGWLPPNGSVHGVALDRLLFWNLGVLTALLILAHFLLFWAVMRHHVRTGSTGQLPFYRGPHLPMQTLVAWLPLLACTALFGLMALTSERVWAGLRFQGPSPAAMQVEVVGVQFQWYFRYPGGDATFGRTRPQLVDAAAGNPLGLDPADPAASDDLVASVLVLPAGHEVDLRLRAHDVIHGFFIPGMRLKQNAVPGLLLHVHFTPVAPGDYPILCTQVCGSGHARMQALLRVLPPAQFASWLAAREHQAAAPQASADRGR